MPTKATYCLAAVFILLCGTSFAVPASVLQESLDLTGQTLKYGSTITVTGTAPLAPAHIYSYTVDGVLDVTGSGLFTYISGGGSDEDFDQAVDAIIPGLAPYLNDTVVNVSGANPFVFVNKVGFGTYSFYDIGGGPLSADDISGMLRLKAGLNKFGVPYVDISNFKVSLLLPPAGYRVDKSDSYVFTSGSMTISAIGVSGSTPAPDLAIMGADSPLIGIGITGTDGSSEAYEAYLEQNVTEKAEVVLLNSGSSAGAFKLTAPAVSGSTGFVQKFVVGGKDVTAAITGSNGYTTKSIGGGDVQMLTWDVTNKVATSATFSNLLTAVTSGTGVTGTDAVGLYLVGP